jgi:anaphase-promoting complex subunit 6
MDSMECESSMDMSQGADSFADMGAHSPAPPASSASFAASASVSFSASASSAASAPAPASFTHAATASASPLSQLDGLRRLVHSHVSDRAYQSAIFFASSLVSLSGGAPDDVYLVAETHFAAGAYKRAIHVLRQHDLMGSPDAHRALRARYLAAQSLAAGKNWTECLQLLGEAFPMATGDRDEAEVAAAEAARHPHRRGEETNLVASMCLLQGRAFEATENRERAARWYYAALRCDVYCFDAFERLVSHHMLPLCGPHPRSSRNQDGLLDTLRFDDGEEWLRLSYAAMLERHKGGAQVGDKFMSLEERFAATAEAAQADRAAAAEEERKGEGEGEGEGDGSAGVEGEGGFAGVEGFGLGGFGRGGARGRVRGGVSGGAVQPHINQMMLTTKAECLFYDNDSRGAYDITRYLREADPFELSCVAVHLAAMTDLEMKSELFFCAHQLVDAYPDKAVAWFAVGCYYFLVKKFDPARRYFSKATTIDPQFTPAWIGFGHAFASQDESDQAMNAYRTTQRLFPGCHMPALYTGMEYLRTNNLVLAEQFFRQSEGMCPTDPLIHNELGVVQ